MPTLASPRKARMIATSAQSPIGGRQEEIGDAEENLAEVRQVLVARVVLEVRVRDEGDDAVKDGARGQHPLVVGIQRHPGCSASTRKPKTNSTVLKTSSETRYCFQFCGPLSRRFSNQRNTGRGRIFRPLPTPLAAQGNGDSRRNDDQREREEPCLNEHNLLPPDSVSDLLARSDEPDADSHQRETKEKHSWNP